MPPGSNAEQEPVTLRAAQAGDLDRLAALEREVFGDDGYGLESLRALLASRDRRDPPTDLRVACDPLGRIAGFAVGQVLAIESFCERYGLDVQALLQCLPPARWVGYVKSMAVPPARRRSGIGRQLTRARDEFFASENVRLLLLWQMDRPGLVGFHGAMGYRRLPLQGRLRYADGSRPSLWWRPLDR